MLITSKYDAQCRDCGANISRGDRVDWIRGRRGVRCMDCHHETSPPADDTPTRDGWAVLFGRNGQLQTFGPLNSEQMGELWALVTSWGYQAHQAPRALDNGPEPKTAPSAPEKAPEPPRALPQPSAPTPPVAAPEPATDPMAALMDMMKAAS